MHEVVTEVHAVQWAPVHEVVTEVLAVQWAQVHEVVTEVHEARDLHKIEVGKEIVRTMKYVEQEGDQ